jgi:hypothetical protein
MAVWTKLVDTLLGPSITARRQRGSAEVIGDDTEVSAACLQIAALAVGRGGVSRGDPTRGPWRGAGQNRARARGIGEFFP